MSRKSIILLLASLLFLVFVPGLRLYLMIIIWVILFCGSLKQASANMPLIAFLIAIFTFLMSRLTIPIFYKNDYISDSLDNMITFKDSTLDVVYCLLVVSMVSVCVGYYNNKNNAKIKLQFDPQNATILRIRKASRWLFYFSSMFFFLQLFEKALFVWRNGYMDFYLSYEKMLPGIFYRFALFFQLSFYIYMATLPSKEEVKRIAIFYIFAYFLSLLTGARGEFILAVMFVIIYYVIRHYMRPDECWVTKKSFIFAAVAFPTICALMFVIMLIRGESELENNAFLLLLVDFFYSQGSSIQVVGLTVENQASIPPDKFYSFGQIIDNFNNNFIFHLLGIAKEYRSNSDEMAVYGHSLANYLTYTYQYKRFSQGGGLGSSYVAEVWNDFGYIGLAIWSYLYGKILAYIYKLIGKNVWLTALSFFMMMSIIYAPRASAIAFIADILSPTYLLALFFIYQYSKRR